MTINLVKSSVFAAIIITCISLAIAYPPKVGPESVSSISVVVLEAIAIITALTTLLILFFYKYKQITNKFKFMLVVTLCISVLFFWAGNSYLDVIKKNTRLCNGERVLIGTKLTFPSDSIYTDEQLLSQRGCNPQQIWEKASFAYPEKQLRNLYFCVYPLLVFSLLSLSQCIFNLKSIKYFFMGFFAKKVKCKRFYETKSRTIDITGLKTGITEKFDFGLATFKIDTRYQNASDKLKTLDLLQYGLCNDINGVSNVKQKDMLLQKIIETKTKMLEIVLELNSGTDKKTKDDVS